ncbi:hypothetical protein WICPIJ_004202 [Wickerhamomyces pijperi]|uniref:Pre-mRNA-splicing factor SLU7 n=1 Tax=Wickerhamomyces pijperi TaxID=599730 RepID=A0A9P8Q8H6_WICPI|nr:hypothetical protein WICPIJ_004202 [Wickerhamomyces pijperi]
MPRDNKHIPKYIKDAPWYNSDTTGQSDDPLAHHRNADSHLVNSGKPKVGAGIVDEFLELDTSTDNTSVRLKKDGSKAQVAPEKDQKLIRKDASTYDMKRDRWYGYNSELYITSQKESSTGSEEKKEAETVTMDLDEEIELKELGLWDLYRTNPSIFSKDQTKLVRLREDKAVYLKNISDSNDITYDPKSRTDRSDSVGYFNDRNLFTRHLTGDAKKYQQSNVFAWDDNKRTSEISSTNVTSNPTLSEIRNTSKKPAMNKDLFSKYTQQESNGSDDEDHKNDQNNKSNQNEELKNPTPQYLEDVFIANHTSIWGSYYQDGRWGFKCCKKFDKDSLCD